MQVPAADGSNNINISFTCRGPGPGLRKGRPVLWSCIVLNGLKLRNNDGY